MNEEDVIYTTPHAFSEEEMGKVNSVQRFFDGFTDYSLKLDEDEATLGDIHDDLCKIDGDLKTIAYYMSVLADQKVN